MRKQDWKSETYSLAWLREQQGSFTRASLTSPIFDWLKAIGAVPQDQPVLSWGHNQNTPLLNPDSIRIGYLAMVACEWDSWGPSTPTEFLDAMELETEGHERRDTIAETLTALGRAIAEEESEEKTYRLRLPQGYAA